MVVIKLTRDEQNCFTGFVCSGHASYADHGTDIVCAAISTLTHTTVLALEQLVKLPIQVEADVAQGYLSCSWVNHSASLEKADLVIREMLLGLSEIQKQYPEYLVVSEVEVE